MIKTQGINHPALIAANLEETVRFYAAVLGMRLVLRQPNLDDPSMTHLFFDAGRGSFLAFFAPSDASMAPPPTVPGTGMMQHVALNLDTPLEEAMDTLRHHGVPFSGPVDRGYERSLYFRDPNGIMVELLTWITPLPEGADEAGVIAGAQRLREQEGAYAIEDRHVRQAMADLGLRPPGQR